MKPIITPEMENQRIVDKAIKKNNSELAQAIQKEMNLQGLFPKHIVRITGMQRTHLDKILTGKFPITIPTLIKICVALKCNLNLDCTGKNGDVVSTYLTKENETPTTA